MNKKLVLFILLACLLPLSLSASWSFAYDSWDGHPQLLPDWFQLESGREL